MGDDTATVRIRPAWSSNHAAIAPERAAELRELYSELQAAATAAAKALSATGALPAGLALQRFRELDGRVVELNDRIREIL